MTDAAKPNISSVPYDQHEREVLEVIDQRDNAEEWLDKLCAEVGRMGADIGEHSSSNNPWANALDFLAGFNHAR